MDRWSSPRLRGRRARDFVGAGLPAQHPLNFVGAGLPALHPIIRVNSVHVRNAIAVMLANVGGKLLLQG